MKLDFQTMNNMINETRDHAANGAGSITKWLRGPNDTYIMFSADPIETAHEIYAISPRIEILRNNQKEILYSMGSSYISPHDSFTMKTYTYGEFNQPGDALTYLAEKYKNVDFDETEGPYVIPPQNKHYNIQWTPGETSSGDKWSEHPARYDPDNTERLIWRSHGTCTMNIPDASGNTHPEQRQIVEFAYAYDMPDTHVRLTDHYPINRSRPNKDPNRPNITAHTIRLPMSLYERLQRCSGPGQAKWDGCVNALLDNVINKDGKIQRLPNLTKQAEESGCLYPPETPFNLSKHLTAFKNNTDNQRYLPTAPAYPDHDADQQDQPDN